MDNGPASPLAALVARLEVLTARLDAQSRIASLQSVRIERLEDELCRRDPIPVETGGRSWSRAAGRHAG